MMDSQGSFKPLFTTRSQAANAAAVLWQLARYALCVAVGLLGGALGVALATAIAILIQLRLPPPSVFAPGLVPLMVAAAVGGLPISWLLGWLAHQGWPGLGSGLRLNGLQVILVSSVFASLAQSLLLFA